MFIRFMIENVEALVSFPNQFCKKVITSNQDWVSENVDFSGKNALFHGVQFPSSPCRSLENIGFSRLPLFGVIKKVINEGLICPEFRDLAQNILFYFNRFSVTVVMRFCTENICMPHNILD